MLGRALYIMCALSIENYGNSWFIQDVLLSVIRKPVRKTSLFKFMTVLRLEVWLSIVGALTVTGIMIWILDKYSPYSAQNNKGLYPYPCRYNMHISFSDFLNGCDNGLFIMQTLCWTLSIVWSIFKIHILKKMHILPLSIVKGIIFSLAS
jgi:hypothetical protein